MSNVTVFFKHVTSSKSLWIFPSISVLTFVLVLKYCTIWIKAPRNKCQHRNVRQSAWTSFFVHGILSHWSGARVDKIIPWYNSKCDLKVLTKLVQWHRSSGRTLWPPSSILKMEAESSSENLGYNNFFPNSFQFTHNSNIRRHIV